MAKRKNRQPKSIEELKALQAGGELSSADLDEYERKERKNIEGPPTDWDKKVRVPKLSGKKLVGDKAVKMTPEELEEAKEKYGGQKREPQSMKDLKKKYEESVKESDEMEYQDNKKKFKKHIRRDQMDDKKMREEIRKKLRPESGAAISEEEYKHYKKKYFPKKKKKKSQPRSIDDLKKIRDEKLRRESGAAISGEE